MKKETFAGRTFEVTSVSYGSDEGDSLEFVIADGPAIAVSRRDQGTSGTLYVSVDGEVEAAVLEELIVYSKRRFGFE